MSSHVNNIDKLLNLVEAATSPFHTIAASAQELLNAGFQRLELRDKWELERGGRYFLIHHGAAVFAFTIGSSFQPADGFRMAAAHGDFPGFRIKPAPEMNKDGYLMLNIETYGGVNLSSWMDRPLSVAGRVMLRTADAFHPEERLIDLKKSIFTIPNSSVHLNRDLADKGAELNRQTHMVPLAGCGGIKGVEEKAFISYLAKALGTEPDQILEYELNVYNTDPGDVVGLDGDLVSAPRLDDLTSVQAILTAVTEGIRSTGINMGIVFDHEEIGSGTKQGAGSTVLPTLLEKIYGALSYGRDEYLCAIQDSMLLSVDVAQGLHPNYLEKYDLTTKARLNGGFCIKESSRQAYATDSEAIAIVQQICEAGNIAYQKCVNRSDILGGGTLGSIASAVLPVRTVDIGVPLLSMHSSRELMGAKDMDSITECIQAFFSAE